MSDTESNHPIVMNEEQMTYFKQFCAKEDEKKERAQKKRLTKKGDPDRRSETSKQNVSKAREKVKEYLSMSKAVLNEDTDDEYLDIVVKKKSRPMTKYMETKLRTEIIEPTPEPETTPPTPEPTPEPKTVVRKPRPTKRIETVEVKEVIKPTPVQPEVKINPYASMFGHTTTNVNALRQKLALRF
jgi:hypothetical protein